MTKQQITTQIEELEAKLKELKEAEEKRDEWLELFGLEGGGK